MVWLLQSKDLKVNLKSINQNRSQIHSKINLNKKMIMEVLVNLLTQAD